MHREGVEVYLHSFTTSALDGRGRSIPAPREEAPGHVTGCAPGHVGTWDGEQNISCTHWGSHPGHSSP
jgi:hypothetical protein